MSRSVIVLEWLSISSRILLYPVIPFSLAVTCVLCPVFVSNGRTFSGAVRNSDYYVVFDYMITVDRNSPRIFYLRYSSAKYEYIAYSAHL